MRIEKSTAIAGMATLILLIIAYLWIPTILFESEDLGNCITWGAIIGILIKGVQEIGAEEKKPKLYITQLLLCGFIGYCLSALTFIGFGNIGYKSAISLAQCAALFASYLLVAYIIESIVVNRKPK